MKRQMLKLVFSAFLVFCAGGVAMAAIDPPHDYTNSCNQCHNSAALSNAANLIGSIDNTPINVACRGCHSATGGKTPKVTHSSTQSAPALQVKFGDWTYDCVACHNPHYQRMNRAYSGTGTYPNGPKLHYGVLSGNSVTNTITLSNVPAGVAVNALRGYTIVPNTRYGGYAYRIVGNNGATINTERTIYSYYARSGASYAIYYGNLMLDSIDRGKPISNSDGYVIDANTRYATIKMFNSTGPKSSVYNTDTTDPNTTAICINCHTKTKINNIGYIKYSVSFDKPTVVNATTMSHNTSASSTCWATPDSCHNPPAQGFSRSAAACGECHGTNMNDNTSLVKKIKIGYNLIANTTGILNVGAHPAHQNRYTVGACDYCHFTGMKPSEADLESTSFNSVGDYNTTMVFNMASPSYPGVRYTSGLYNGFKNTNQAGPNNIYNVAFKYNGVSAGPMDSTNLCSNVYCHGVTMPTNGGTNFKPNWYQSSTGSCGSCHAATGANPPRLGSHIKHTGVANVTMFSAQACSVCHPHDGSGSLHVDGDVNMSLSSGKYNGAASNAVSSVPSEVYSNCTTLYCHGNANPVGGTDVPKTILWGSAALNCGSCHSQPSDASPNWSAAHTKHVKNYGSSINCNDCHSNVANNNTTINVANKALHVDGVKNVVINTTDHGATASYSGGTCTQVNCHGTGVRLDTGTNVNTPAAWNASLGCDGCHKAAATTAVMTTGNVMSSAHVKHVATDEYGSRGVKPIDCKSCHKGTASSGSVINSTVLHVNLSKNVSYDTTWTLDSPTWTSPNCTTYCHSTGTATPVYYPVSWTNPASGACGTCHGVIRSAFYNATVKHQGHINTTYYKYGCSTCHSGVVSATINSSVQPTVLDKTAHVDKASTVVFNALSTQTGSSSTSWNGTNCTTYCHSTGKTVAGGNLPAAYGSSNFTTQTWSGTMACNSCHGKTNPSGRPDYTSEGSGSAGANSHQMFDTPLYSHGLSKCYTCHALTVNNTNTVIVNAVHVDGTIDVNFNSEITVGTWSSADKKCSNLECHAGAGGITHSAGAQWGIAGGCTTCHGQPPIAFATMLNGTYKTGRGYSGFVSNGVGKHAYHFTTKGYNCDTCHNGGQLQGSHLTTPPRLDLGFKVNGNLNGVYNAPAFNGGSTILVGNGTTTYNQTGTTRVCKNIYCHSDGGNYAMTTFVYQAADWDGAAYSSACNQCHGNATRRAISTLHPVHENTYGYECSICHRDTVSVGNTLIGTIGNHVDFEKDVAFDAANGLTTGASWAKPTCTTYCHTKGTHASNFNAPHAPNYTAQWNSTLPANCVGCHSGAATASANMNTVAHLTHINNASYVGWNIGCQECHRSTVSANTTVSGIANHVNKLVNVKFDNSKNLDSDGPLYNTVSTTSGPGSTRTPGSSAANCANVYCHSYGNIGVGANMANNVFKTVAWNTANIGCAGCHGDNSTKSHPVYANTGANLDNSNSHIAHVEAALYACDICHITTTTDTSIPPTTVIVGGGHINRVENVAFKTWGGQTGTYTASKGCNNTYCHGTTGPLWGGPAMSCASCHPSEGAGGAVSVMTPAHNLHVNTTTAYYYSCEECHDSNQTAHPGGLANAGWNQAAEVKFESALALWSTGQNYLGSATATYRAGKITNNPFTNGVVAPAYIQGNANTTDASGMKYTTNGTCTTVWCHSNANPVGVPNLYNTVTWNQTTGCNSCHSSGSEAGSRSWSVAHDKHVKTYGSNTQLTCKACHAGTTTNNTAIAAGYGFTNHVNGTKDVVFSTFSNSAVPYNGTTDQCSTYCHSTGKNIAVANLTGAYSGNNYTTPTWSGTLGCNGCHGKNNSSGRPDYTSGGSNKPDSNSHSFFSTADSHGTALCSSCHALTVDVTNTVIVNASGHVDGIINVNFGGGVTMTWNGGTKTCSGAVCHAKSNHTASVAWGGTGSCTSCHGQPPIAFGSMLNGSDDTGRSHTTFVNNGVGAHAYHFARYAACDTCHYGGQYQGSHLDAPRLDIGFKVNGNYNGVYNAPAFTGPSIILVGNGTTTYNQTGTTRLCSSIYCHSDGGNYNLSTFIYQAANWDDSAYTTACNQCHGNATRRAITTLHPVHENTYGYECSLCHRGTVSGTSTLVGNHVNFTKEVQFDANNGLSAGGTWTKPTCTTSYCHSQGTSAYTAPNYTAQWNSTLPANCIGCHSGDAASGDGMGSGIHTAHVDSATTVGRDIGCQECHLSTVSANRTVSGIANHVNRLVNVKFDNSLNRNSDNPTYIGNSTTVAAGSTKGPGSAVGNCANLFCHSYGNVGASIANNTFKSVAWSGTLGGCVACHGNNVDKAHPVYANTGPNVDNSNSHVAHVDAALYACDICHITTTTDTALLPTNVIVNGAHLNRVENVVFKTWGGQTGTYTATKDCNNTYCHGTTGPKWGGPAMNCASCHPSMGSGGTPSVMAPAHNLHVNTTTGYYYSCAVCHDDSQTAHPGGLANAGWNQAGEVKFQDAGASWTTGSYRGSATNTYRDRRINYNELIPGAATPAYVQGNANTIDASGMKYTTNGTCTNVWCHSNASPTGGTNIYNTVTWNQANTGCNFCHASGSEAGSRSWSVKHDKHVKTYGANADFTCKACHAGTATNNTAIASGFGFTNHVNGAKDVVFSTFANTGAATWSSGTLLCGNTYCHSRGTSFSSATHAQLAWSDGAQNCDTCHGTLQVANEVDGYGMPDYSSGSPKANSHWQHVENGSNCKNCHGTTVTSMSQSNTISGFGLHMNKTYDLAAAGNFPGAGSANVVSFTVAVQGTDVTPTQCSNVSCHAGSNATWGTNASCQSCHAANLVDKDNFTYLDGTKAMINATVWNAAGHGSSSAYASGNAGANLSSIGANMCLYCHNDSTPHTQSTNFFRLKDIANALYGANGSCMACHAAGSSGVTVSAVNKNSSRKVGSRHYGSTDHTVSRSGGQFCWDCHDPHGDKNKNGTNNWYMIHNRPYEVSNATTMKPTTLTLNTVVFTAATTGTDYANNGAYDGVCNVCHTSTNYYWKGPGSPGVGGDTHHSGEKCTGCHAHTKAGEWDSGFAGAGESTGGQACTTCHSDVYNRMHDGTANMMYKHFMNSDSAAYYPLVNSPAANSLDKTCLMCHVDHGIFSDNANATRASNLRKSANINTITTSAGFTNSDYDSVTGGICYSCHFKAQVKTLTTNNGVVNIPPVPLVNTGTIANLLSVSGTSTHIYNIPSGPFTTDASKFYGVCVKCHDDTMDDGTGAKSDKGAQTADPRFGMHQGGRDTFFGVMGADNTSLESVVTGKIASLAAANTVTLNRNIFNSFNGFALVVTKADGTQSQRKIIGSSDPALDQVTLKQGDTWLFTPATDMYFEIIKNISPPDEICLQCHSLQADGYKPVANKDFYNAVSMSSNLESILNSMFADKGKVRTATTANATSVVVCTNNLWVNNTLKMYSLEIGGYRGLVKITPVNAAGDATCSGTYGQANSFTLGGLVPAIPTAISAGSKYTLYKFTHPLDKYGRHDMAEPVNAPLNNSTMWNASLANSTAWAVGDMGDCNTGVTATVCGDTNKMWPVNGFKNLYATFTSGQCSGKSYTISTNAATSFTLSSTTANCAGTGTQIAAGDSYYIGTRHVSCNDCHNPHAAQKKAGGVGANVSFPSTYTLKDTARKAAETGWGTNKWVGYLLVVTGKNGTNDTMFRQVRQINNSTTDATGTTYGFGLQMQWSDATSWTYEVLKLNGESGPGARGTWGVKVGNFSTPALGTLQDPATLKFTKVYDTADPVSVGKQYELCLKCHSYYGFGTAYPTAISGGPNNSNAMSTDLAIEFNTNNLAHHAVFGIGRNQPLPFNGVKKLGDAGVASRLSASWSNVAGTGVISGAGGGGWVSGMTIANTVLPGWYAKMSSPTANVWYQVVMVNTTNSFRIAATDGNPWGTITSYPTTGTITVITPGLGDTFVPPYGPWAIIRCTECHGSKLSDPLGPHASTNKWLIKDAESNLKFQWYKSGVYNKITYGAGNNTFDITYFCYNCHRADVYVPKAVGLAGTNAANAPLSRVAHGGAATGMWDGCDTSTSRINSTVFEGIWGQYCRLCHMGEKVGAAHGTNKMNTSTTAGWNKQGRRFLNGMSWGAALGDTALRLGTTSMAGSCYLASANTVGSCAQGHGDTEGQATTATYNYDAP